DLQADQAVDQQEHVVHDLRCTCRGARTVQLNLGANHLGECLLPKLAGDDSHLRVLVRRGRAVYGGPNILPDPCFHGLLDLLMSLAPRGLVNGQVVLAHGAPPPLGFTPTQGERASAMPAGGSAQMTEPSVVGLDRREEGRWKLLPSTGNSGDTAEQFACPR